MRPEELVALARRYERALRHVESERRELREKIEDARADALQHAHREPPLIKQKPPRVRDDVEAWLLDLLADGPVASAEIERLAGSRWRTAKRIKSNLGVRSVKRGAAWWWEAGQAGQNPVEPSG